jgi:hypothetical protein
MFVDSWGIKGFLFSCMDNRPTAGNYSVTVNTEFERMWKEMGLACFEVCYPIIVLKRLRKSETNLVRVVCLRDEIRTPALHNTKRVFY